MFQLNAYSKEDMAAHLELYADRLKRGFDMFCNSIDCNNNAERLYSEFVKSISVEDVLGGSVDRLRSLVEDYDTMLPLGKFYRKRAKQQTDDERTFTRLNKLLFKIVDYDDFMRVKKAHAGEWSGWTLAQKIFKRVKYCPYCNAETVYAFECSKNGTLKSVRTAFDHYYPRARYPLLGLALYNIIPSCWRCNTSFKGDEVPSFSMAHPFKDNMDCGMRFDVLFKKMRAFMFCEAKDLQGIIFHEKSLGACPSGVEWDNMFKISKTYTSLFLNDAAAILNRIMQFPKSYLQERFEHLTSIGVPVGRVQELLYGANLEGNMNKYRFGKLIKDLSAIYRL